MANMCDNILEFTAKVIPTWFKKDPEHPHGISIEWEDRFLFLYGNFDDIMSDETTHWVEEDWSHTFRIGFETKWAPPTTLYERMVKDDTIISFSATWYEPWCGCLGYANKDEGIVDDDAPDRFYSDCLDLDILKEDPPQSYIDINGDDSWITFEKYKTDMAERLSSVDAEEKVRMVEEVKEITEYFE